MKVFLKNSLWLLVLVLFFGSCKEGGQSSKDLEMQVMNIHDGVMPKMSNIQSAKKELEVALKAGADSTRVFDMLAKLDEADEAMMEWMADYSLPGDGATEEEKLTYLKVELTRIKEVEQKMLSSLKNVELLTKDYVKPINDSL
jgi:hypothetical protein